MFLSFLCHNDMFRHEDYLFGKFHYNDIHTTAFFCALLLGNTINNIQSLERFINYYSCFACPLGMHQ